VSDFYLPVSAECRLWVICDRIESETVPVMSAVLPKAEVKLRTSGGRSPARAILMVAPKTRIRKSIQADLAAQPSRKNLPLHRRANQWFFFARPAPDQEGRFAIVTNVGCGMRWTRRYRRRTMLIRLR
jgi:hypothetical protein